MRTSTISATAVQRRGRGRGNVDWYTAKIPSMFIYATGAGRLVSILCLSDVVFDEVARLRSYLVVVAFRRAREVVLVDGYILFR